jgi:hypothetical protein
MITIPAVMGVAIIAASVNNVSIAPTEEDRIYG